MNSNITKLTENYVLALLTEKSPAYNAYHSIDHTREVVAAAIDIARGENISDEDLEILTIAAWFHDTGYIEKTDGHEEISAMFASGFLASHSYAPNKIDKVVGCILSTKLPQQPKNHIQQIICDADLHHLGTVTFKARNDLFRAEVEYYSKKELTESELLIQSIEFLSEHSFFTNYAIKNFSPIQNQNLQQLKKQLDALNK